MKSLNLNELTVEQKIGQLFVVRRFVNEEDRQFVYKMLEKRCVGGIQVPCDENCVAEIEEIKKHVDYPVLICNDMERGFPASKYIIPSMMGLSITNDLELAYQVGAVTAIEAKRRGYNTVWGPNVDMVLKNAMCKIPRIFGSDPDHVAKMSAAILKGYYDNGMIASAKHWPGPIDVEKDGHVFSNESSLTEEDIINKVFVPYKYAMETVGLNAVMTGHSFYKSIDDTYPGTLSEKLIGILRKQGFDGLIFTDSFAMIGILQKFGEEACYGRAIKAGNDMVLPNYRTPFEISYNYMLKAYKEGVFTEERLNNAVRHVVEAQNFTLKEAISKEVSSYQKECFKKIEKNSICVKYDDNTTLKLDDNTKKLFVVLCENNYLDGDDISYEICDNCGINEQNIKIVKDSILKRYPDSEVMAINQYPSIKQIERVCNAAVKADEVIYITYTSSNSYRIGENLTENVVNLMESMKYKISAVAHIGNPYALERIPHVPRILISVGGREHMVEYFMAALSGEYMPEGKLPLEVNFK